MFTQVHSSNRRSDQQYFEDRRRRLFGRTECRVKEKVKNQDDIEVFSLSNGKAGLAISETEHRL